MIEVTVNGEAVALEDPNLEALVGRSVQSKRGVAVAVNGEVVPRSAWPSQQLSSGDRVEVLQAAAGG